MKLSIETHNIDYSKRGDAAKTRVYVHPKGETGLDNFMNRRNRPIKLYRAALLQGLAELNVDMSNISYRWSKRAGCNCGCSPGFILDGFDPAILRKNVWIAVLAD